MTCNPSTLDFQNPLYAIYFVLTILQSHCLIFVWLGLLQVSLLSHQAEEVSVAPHAHHRIPANLLFAGAVLLSLSTQCCSALHKSFLLLCTSHTCEISFSESPLVSQLSAFYLPAFLLSADFSHCILSPPLCIFVSCLCTNIGAQTQVHFSKGFSLCL